MTAARELRAAHTIIRNALAVMTTAQKAKWGARNERDDVDGEGITRAHEREAALAAAADLAHELHLAARMFTQDARRADALEVDRVCLTPAGAAQLAALLTRAVHALAAHNSPNKEA